MVTTLSAIAFATCAMTVSPTLASSGLTSLVTSGEFDDCVDDPVPNDKSQLLEACVPTRPPINPTTNVSNTPSARRRGLPAAVCDAGTGGGGNGEPNSLSSGDGVIQLVMALFYRRIATTSQQMHAFFTNS
jgi:hypothetical protein